MWSGYISSFYLLRGVNSQKNTKPFFRAYKRISAKKEGAVLCPKGRKGKVWITIFRQLSVADPKAG